MGYTTERQCLTALRAETPSGWRRTEGSACRAAKKGAVSEKKGSGNASERQRLREGRQWKRKRKTVPYLPSKQPRHHLRPAVLRRHHQQRATAAAGLPEELGDRPPLTSGPVGRCSPARKGSALKKNGDFIHKQKALPSRKRKAVPQRRKVVETQSKGAAFAQRERQCRYLRVRADGRQHQAALCSKPPPAPPRRRPPQQARRPPRRRSPGVPLLPRCRRQASLEPFRLAFQMAFLPPLPPPLLLLPAVQSPAGGRWC